MMIILKILKIYNFLWKAYSSQERPKVTLSSKALNSGSIMDHSVKAMNSHRKVAFSRLFNRHRFENSELECLFRRYILRVQHASITSAVALFVVLTAAMATASFIKVQAPTLSNLYHSLHCGVFVILFIVLCTRSIEDLYLNYVCYTIIFFCTAFFVVALHYRLLLKTWSVG